MITANTSVTAFAIITGILLLNKPKRNHNKVPDAKSEYMNKDMPLVSFVRMVLIACGKKDAVVKIAAAKPMIVVIFIYRFMKSLKVDIKKQTEYLKKSSGKFFAELLPINPKPENLCLKYFN